MDICQAKSIKELEEWYEYAFIGEEEYQRQLDVILNGNVDEEEMTDEISNEDVDEVPKELPEDEEYDNDDGTRTQIHYFYDDQNRMCKRVRKVKTVTITQKIPKRVLARRNIPKFGKCANMDDSKITYFGDTIEFKIAKNPVNDQKKNDVPSGFATLTCRACGQMGHFTAQCPMRDQMEELQSKIYESIGVEDNSPSTSGPGKYVPPSKRSGASGVDTPSESNTNIKVSNITEEATQDDIKDLFSRFGTLKRVTLVTNKRTGRSKGFGYVDFEYKADAQEAMNRLARYPYGNQILELTWAKNRK